jgi:hypothetical protein
MKEYLKTQPVIVFFKDLYEYFLWKLKGSTGGSPHLYKQRTLRRYSLKYNLKCFVETGTYLGHMVYAMKNIFTKIFSIELSHVIFQKAQLRFKNYGHIKILEGDSAVVLNSLVNQLNEPVLFWLDGHYSGGETAKADLDTPVIEEIKIILKNFKQPFVILIDDARLFVGKNGYPSLNELEQLVFNLRPNLKLVNEQDIIRITPI